MEVFEDGLEQRYYYIENRHDGAQSQMGALTGWDTIEDLKRDQQFSIGRNKEEGRSCWIVKREVVEKLS